MDKTPISFVWPTIAVLLSLFTLLLVLSGCAEQTPDERQAYVDKRSVLLGVVDGCRIWEVYNPNGGPNPFLARCPEGAADTFNTYRSGKITKESFTTGG